MKASKAQKTADVPVKGLSQLIALVEIEPDPNNVRQKMDKAKLKELTDSIQEKGVVQPILIRPHQAEGNSPVRYRIIAGERRYRASLAAGCTEIPAILWEVEEGKELDLQLIENLQREDLNAIEKATAFRQYLDTYGGTQDELAGRLGLERPTIGNLLRLLSLPEEVQEAVRSKAISAGHARALLALTNPDAQRGCCGRIVAEGLSVRQTEALVATGDPNVPRPRVRKDPAHGDATPKDGKPPHVLEWETHLQQRFGTPVSFRVKGPDRGQIVIEFQNREDLDRVMGLIRG